MVLDSTTFLWVLSNTVKYGPEEALEYIVVIEVNFAIFLNITANSTGV